LLSVCHRPDFFVCDVFNVIFKGDAAYVQQLIIVPMEDDDLEVLLEADGGDATAQSDLGQMFAIAGKHDISKSTGLNKQQIKAMPTRCNG
jgi:hypothetical protein